MLDLAWKQFRVPQGPQRFDVCRYLKRQKKATPSLRSLRLQGSRLVNSPGEMKQDESWQMPDGLTSGDAATCTKTFE